MKVLLLNDRIPPEGRGGAESVAWRLAVGLAAAGHDVHVAAATKAAAFEEIRDGIPTTHLHARYPERFRAWLSLWNPQTAGAFRALLGRVRPDIVNAHNIHFWLSYHSLKLAREAGCGVVYSAHDVMPFAYGKLRHFVKTNARDMNLRTIIACRPLITCGKIASATIHFETRSSDSILRVIRRYERFRVRH